MKRLLILFLLMVPLLVSGQKKKQRPYEYQEGDYRRGDTVFDFRGDVVYIGPATVNTVTYKNAQDTDQIATMNNDTLTIKQPYARFEKGQEVKLGRGTMPDGRFKFIGLVPDSWSAPSTGEQVSYEEDRLAAQWADQVFRVKRFYRYGAKSTGYTYFLKLKRPKLPDFECDIVNAIRTGEVIVQGFTPTLQQPARVADELKKLKELKEQGVLTQDEFDAQKKKLLGQ